MPLRRICYYISGSVRLATSVLITACALTASGQVAPVAVTTYHYDNKRTGWNPNETTLTPSSLASASFGLLHTVTLDDQVDGQPLIVPGVNIVAGNSQGIDRKSVV